MANLARSTPRTIAIDRPMGKLLLPEIDFQPSRCAAGTRRSPRIMPIPASIDAENTKPKRGMVDAGMKRISAESIFTSPPPKSLRQKAAKPSTKTVAATAIRATRSSGGARSAVRPKKATAMMLSVFGIRPKAMRISGKVMRGYESAQFADPFARYLEDHPEEEGDDE